MRTSSATSRASMVTRPSPGQSAPRASFGNTTVPCCCVNSTARLCSQCLHSCWRYLLARAVGTEVIAETVIGGTIQGDAGGGNNQPPAEDLQAGDAAHDLEALDLLGSLVDQRDDLVEHLAIDVAGAQPVDQHLAQIAHRTPHRGGGGLLPLLAKRGEPRDQRRHQVPVALKLLRSPLGHGELLARALDLAFLDQAHIVEHGEGGIDHARARGVGAAGQAFDLADQVIAVTRFVGDQLQQHEPQLAAVKHAATTAGATTAAPAAPAPTATMMAPATTDTIAIHARVAATAAIKIYKHSCSPFYITMALRYFSVFFTHLTLLLFCCVF